MEPIIATVVNNWVDSGVVNRMTVSSEMKMSFCTGDSVHQVADELVHLRVSL